VHAKFREVVATIAGTPPNAFDDPEYWRGQLNTYYDLITGTDEMLGAAVKAVIDAGALENTAIIRTADHGELGSAHRMQNKGTTIYDEQNRVPFTIVYPRRFARGARSEALGEAIDLVPTLLELAGEPDPVKRWPWLRGVSLVPALDNPSARGPRDHTMFRIDEYPVTNVGTAVPTPSHIRQIYDGRFKFARYVAIKDQHFAGPEVPGSEEHELYDTWNDPYEIRNLANDPGYQSLKADMLAWLLEREKVQYAPVGLPEYGPNGPITHIPEPPSVNLLTGGIPNPWPNISKPGAYLVVPAQQPTPTRFLYEGALPQGIGGGKPTGADLARFFCQLAPTT
jgi:arylsulfatase A-like enzyme